MEISHSPNIYGNPEGPYPIKYIYFPFRDNNFKLPGKEVILFIPFISAPKICEK